MTLKDAPDGPFAAGSTMAQSRPLSAAADEESGSVYRVLFLVALASLAAASACGGNSESSNGDVTRAPAGDASLGAAQPARMSPAELGDAVFARASEGIQKVTKLVEGHPPAAEVKPRVAELKEATIQQLVSLGRQYETLGATDRAQVDARVNLGFDQASNSDWYKAYARTTSLYMSEDAELSKQIQSFNTITQYAFFELLKKQEPADAQRLGIK